MFTWAELKILDINTRNMLSNLLAQLNRAGTNSLIVVSTTTPDGSQTNWNINSSTYDKQKKKNWRNL